LVAATFVPETVIVPVPNWPSETVRPAGRTASEPLIVVLRSYFDPAG
jgi:hypothetical protein